jgi:hypothetical protein
MLENDNEGVVVNVVTKNRLGPGSPKLKRRANAFDEPEDIPEIGSSKPINLRRSPVKSQVV